MVWLVCVWLLTFAHGSVCLCLLVVVCCVGLRMIVCLCMLACICQFVQRVVYVCVCLCVVAYVCVCLFMVVHVVCMFVHECVCV